MSEWKIIYRIIEPRFLKKVKSSRIVDIILLRKNYFTSLTLIFKIIFLSINNFFMYHLNIFYFFWWNFFTNDIFYKNFSSRIANRELVRLVRGEAFLITELISWSWTVNSRFHAEDPALLNPADDTEITRISSQRKSLIRWVLGQESIERSWRSLE